MHDQTETDVKLDKFCKINLETSKNNGLKYCKTKISLQNS